MEGIEPLRYHAGRGALQTRHLVSLDPKLVKSENVRDVGLADGGDSGVTISVGGMSKYPAAGEITPEGDSTVCIGCPRETSFLRHLIMINAKHRLRPIGHLRF